jgi:hypothetical protein
MHNSNSFGYENPSFKDRKYEYQSVPSNVTILLFTGRYLGSFEIPLRRVRVSIRIRSAGRYFDAIDDFGIRSHHTGLT